MHIPNRAWHAHRVRNISIEIPIVTAANWRAVLIRHQWAPPFKVGHGRERLLKQRNSG
jgi:hypothetical protein